jgi:hypothetical protein
VDNLATYISPARPSSAAGLVRLPASQVCVLVFAASFLLYALTPRAAHLDFSVPRGGEVVHVARSLERTGTFANPFDSLPTGPTSHVAPLYPFFYALVLRVLGEGFVAIALLWVLNIGFVAAQWALLPWLTLRLGLGVVPGLLGAVFAMAFLVFRVDSSWEAGAAGLILVVLCLMMASFITTGGSLRGAVLLGLVSGLAFLTEPTALLPVLAWLLLSLVIQRAAGLRKSLALAGVVLAVSLLVCGPWIARNELLWGKLFFIRDDLGLELYASNNPCAGPSLAENIRSGCHEKTHPNVNPEVARQIAAEGEYAFNQGELRKALSWIEANPRSFLRLTARRFVLFWFPVEADGPLALAVWTITLLSLLGFYRMLQRNPRAALVVAAVLVSYPAVYYIVQSDPRYRVPILWASLLFAGYALEQGLTVLRPSGVPGRKSDRSRAAGLAKP